MKAPLWPVVDADEFLYGAVCLFASRPDFPQKIIGALTRDKAAGKSTALFDYLFVAAPGEAFGAEHYFAGYRVRHPEEVDVAIRASDSSQMVKGAHDTSGRTICTLAASMPIPSSESTGSLTNRRGDAP
jgi:hypothetical protein